MLDTLLANYSENTLTDQILADVISEWLISTAVAHFLGHKYRILGHSLLCSIYETKNGFGKNMACL